MYSRSAWYCRAYVVAMGLRATNDRRLYAYRQAVIPNASPDIVPSFTAAQMRERGAIVAPEADAVPGLLALVEVENGDRAPSYVAGTANFYTVTRYNRSSYYALAVLELGEAVAAAAA